MLTVSVFKDGLQGVLTQDAVSSTSSACAVGKYLAIFEFSFHSKYVTTFSM